MVQAAAVLGELEQEVTCAVADAFFLDVAAEEAEDEASGGEVEGVGEGGERGHGGGHLPVAALVEGWEEDERVELGEDGKAEKEAGEHGLTAVTEEEGEDEEGHDGGVEVARAADLPDEHGEPGVEEGPLAAEAEMTQEMDEADEGKAFKEDHGHLHEGDRGGDPGDEVEEDLRDGRIDGVRVVAAVHVVEEVVVGRAEKGEGGAAGNVTVGTDVGVLDDAIPGVTVDV